MCTHRKKKIRPRKSNARNPKKTTSKRSSKSSRRRLSRCERIHSETRSFSPKPKNWRLSRTKCAKKATSRLRSLSSRKRLVFSKALQLTTNHARILLLVLAFPSASPALEVRPKAGFSYDYFGETYQVTDDRDTVTTISDYGAMVGLSVAHGPAAPLRLRADGDLYYGHESVRARLLIRGE